MRDGQIAQFGRRVLCIVKDMFQCTNGVNDDGSQKKTACTPMHWRLVGSLTNQSLEKH